MKRRSFIALATSAPIGLALSAENQEAVVFATKLNEAKEAWHGKTEDVESGVFVSTDGNLRLEVSLIGKNEHIEEKSVETEDGVETIYVYNGERLPRWVHPQDGVIKQFRFFWDNGEIPIEKRFWNDFGGCRIGQTTVSKESIPDDLMIEFEDFLGNLDGPKVILSADGGTALIHWRIIDMDACCGHRADVRWIISRSGAVMRHRHTTPSAC
ncbi:hypothetical protein HZ994_06080 [Akkermansiaceae bacterium]|nr:hypothetical protein HZ994_06080 [Akkermansiaceae bacterium]